MIEPPEHIPDLRRLNMLRAFLFLLFCAIVVRLWYLQIVKGPELAEMSRTVRTRLVRRVAARGDILDRKGRPLATNRPHFVISVLPDELKKNPQVLPLLAKLLRTTETDLAATLTKNRTMPFDPIPVAEDVGIDVLSQIEEQRLDLPGVLILQDPIRYYVDGALCTHVLGVSRTISAEELDKLRAKGYHGGDSVGKEGLEKTYESDLRGTDGGMQIEVDARGRMRRSLEEIKPLPGHTLRLTLDRDLQKVAYDALKAEADKGHPGAAVAIDPNDGGVLALVSTPSYDLNRYGQDYIQLQKDPMTPLVNRAVNSHYPGGSTYKLVTAAAGLESGTTTPNTGDFCGGSIWVGRLLHCDARSGHGPIEFTRAIGASCNIFFWHTAMRAGQKNLADTAFRFGLGQKTGIDLPSSRDAAGIVPTPEWKKKHHRGPWIMGDLLNMAIGQGDVGVTPIQLANYGAAIANGGTLLRPQLVRAIIDNSGPHPVVLHRLQREARNSIGLTPVQRNALVAGMEKVLEPGGTAYGSHLPGLAVAGKTGSADSYLRGKKVTNSLFVCFAPIEKPRIAIAVVVEDGGHGATTAAPLARLMLKHFFGLHVDDVPIGRSGGGD
jgi:penicillin-binding protein 2